MKVGEILELKEEIEDKWGVPVKIKTHVLEEIDEVYQLEHNPEKFVVSMYITVTGIAFLGYKWNRKGKVKEILSFKPKKNYRYFPDLRTALEKVCEEYTLGKF